MDPRIWRIFGEGRGLPCRLLFKDFGEVALFVDALDDLDHFEAFQGVGGNGA